MKIEGYRLHCNSSYFYRFCGAYHSRRCCEEARGRLVCAPATPEGDFPAQERELLSTMSPIPEENPQSPGNKSFIEDDSDPDKVIEKKVMIMAAPERERSLVIEAEEEMLNDHGDPTMENLMKMGDGALNNMALQLGIVPSILHGWLVDETLSTRTR